MAWLAHRCEVAWVVVVAVVVDVIDLVAIASTISAAVRVSDQYALA